MVSSMPALVSRAYSAAYRKASVIQGKIRFRAHSAGFWVNGTNWTFGKIGHL